MTNKLSGVKKVPLYSVKISFGNGLVRETEDMFEADAKELVRQIQLEMDAGSVSMELEGMIINPSHITIVEIKYNAF